jgi:FMN phosphatase YigB (HAD superfamily)
VSFRTARRRSNSQPGRLRYEVDGEGEPTQLTPIAFYSMRKPSIVVFDLGKVLLDFDYSIAGSKISEHSRKSPAEVKQLLDYSPLLYRYETGLMTRREFFEEIRTATDFRGSFEEFGGFFAAIFWEIPAMIELQTALRRGGTPTYIFSNTNDLAISHVRRDFPFFANFDGYILSYEIGAMKPAAKIYEALETLSGKRGAEILYLDDRQENVDAGAARGWQVILHTTPEESRAAIKVLGLLDQD